jgi:hypothetical protein
MDYVIAIPSYDRYLGIQHKTLKLLQRHNIDFSKVFIFVSPQCYEQYKDLPGILVKSKNTITSTRNHIIEFFPDGKKIVEMDDDIQDIIEMESGESVQNLIQICNESFQILKTSGIWGVNSTDNKFFANMVDKFGVASIVNSFMGYINDKRIKLTVPEKEDFQRVAIASMLHIPILKRGMYGIRTKYWTNKGGIQSHYGFTKRKEVQKKSAAILLLKYPQLCYAITRKNGLIDIRFKKRKKQ